MLLAGAVATLVFCAPGYPGAAGDAQPFLDAFAVAVAQAAKWPVGSLKATYDATEEGGLAKLAASDASLAFVPFPFFVEHAAALKLAPLVQADVTAVGIQEHWTLVAKKGRVSGPAALSGYSILSIAGYAPDFVRSYALADWALPADVKISQNAQVLSVLRRIAAGEQSAALLDATQMGALASLPFASELQAVRESASLPTAILAVVDARVPKTQVAQLRAALLSMSGSAADAEVLANLHLRGFVVPQLPQPPSRP
jgi:hypothetical protein